VATSLLIEITQEMSGLGMFDINDLLANSIGGGVGIFLVISYVWYNKQHQRLRRDLRGKKS
jgi:glycopeptide antibiotics resistance protein